MSGGTAMAKAQTSTARKSHPDSHLLQPRYAVLIASFCGNLKVFRVSQPSTPVSTISLALVQGRTSCVNVRVIVVRQHHV